MAMTIIKTDSRGAYRLIAEHDLYLDETGQRVIVVKEGEEVPKDAATVLSGKGGTIPTRYAKLLEQLDKPAEVEVKAEVAAKVVTEPKPTPQPKLAKPKPVEEKPAP